MLTSDYNDHYQNHRDDQNVAHAPTDLALPVSFAEGDSISLRLVGSQPTTDKGDPGDDFTLEPEPNGGRINIGAFGNTPFAELSGTPAPGEDAGAADAGGAAAAMAPPGESVGCACTVAGARQPSGLALLVLAGLVLLTARRALS